MSEELGNCKPMFTTADGKIASRTMYEFKYIDANIDYDCEIHPCSESHCSSCGKEMTRHPDDGSEMVGFKICINDVVVNKICVNCIRNAVAFINDFDKQKKQDIDKQKENGMSKAKFIELTITYEGKETTTLFPVNRIGCIGHNVAEDCAQVILDDDDIGSMVKESYDEIKAKLQAIGCEIA